MKNFILSCIVAILCVCIAGAVAVYVGNMPVETTWPNKQVRTSVPRRFFVPNGIAKVYHENGKLSYQYQIINNVRNGEVRFYLPNKTLTMNYLNGNLMGNVELKSNIPQKDDNKKKLKIILETGNNIKISYTKEGNDILLTGKRTCPDDNLISVLEAYSAKTTPETFENLMACFSFENFTFKNQLQECTAQGRYVYPDFKSDFKFSCSVTNPSDDIGADFKNLKIDSLYTLREDLLKTKIISKDKSKDSIFIAFKGFQSISRVALDTFLFQENHENISNLISTLMTDLTLSDMQLNIRGKKIWTIKGDFNFFEGFSSPYYISSYTDNAMSSQFKITSDSVDLKALYPISRVPMLSLGLKINESFKIKYKELADKISTTINEQLSAKDDDKTKLIPDLSEYMWDFSDLFNSLNFSLFDLEGQPVINASLQLKRGISSDEIAAAPQSSFAVKLTTYQAGEQAHQAIGSLDNGFVIDGEPADIEDLMALLNNTTINAVLDDIANELDLKYGPIVENAKTHEDYIGVDPFFLGFYKSYKDNILKYKLNLTLSQIPTLAANLQALYEEDESYDNLKASDLIHTGIVTPEMLDSKNSLLNAFGGKIRIIKSATEDDSDTHDAFILVYDKLPAEACFKIATYDWKSINDGFVAIKAVSTGTADVTRAYKNKTFEGRRSGNAYHPYEAQNACGKGQSSSIALKFE